MRVIVKARHMELTQALRQYAIEKLGDPITRVFDRDASRLEIELSELGHLNPHLTKECRITLTAPKASPITIVEIDEEMYKAIDLAHDRLLERVRRFRGKRRSNNRSRKAAAAHRYEVARQNLTLQPEAWELELQEYEQSRWAMRH